MDKTYTNSRGKGRQSGSSTEGSLTSSPVDKRHKFSANAYLENSNKSSEYIAQNLKLVFEKLGKLD